MSKTVTHMVGKPRMTACEKSSRTLAITTNPSSSTCRECVEACGIPWPTAAKIHEDGWTKDVIEAAAIKPPVPVPTPDYHALIARWQNMALVRRQEANQLRNNGGSFLAIACHHARADAIERCIAELQESMGFAKIPPVGTQWAEAEERQRQNAE